ncbi:hypothetical protein SNE40_004114 [Patella caerulea]|uniref:Ribonuclease P/MRP protein subunit POP5 n=1 Tax=Patella caerulea TaxID=87958 RepID=A0AAN8KI77_PATCE
MVRIKNRYTVFEIIYPNKKPQDSNINERACNKAISDAVSQAYGDFGLGILQNNLHVRYMSDWKDVILVKSRRGAHKLLQTAVTVFLKKINDLDVSCRTLHIGGSIKACQRFLIKHYRNQLPSLMLKCSNLNEMRSIQEVIVSMCNNLNNS